MLTYENIKKIYDEENKKDILTLNTLPPQFYQELEDYKKHLGTTQALTPLQHFQIRNTIKQLQELRENKIIIQARTAQEPDLNDTTNMTPEEKEFYQETKKNLKKLRQHQPTNNIYNTQHSLHQLLYKEEPK